MFLQWSRLGPSLDTATQHPTSLALVQQRPRALKSRGTALWPAQSAASAATAVRRGLDVHKTAGLLMLNIAQLTSKALSCPPSSTLAKIPPLCMLRVKT